MPKNYNQYEFESIFQDGESEYQILIHDTLNNERKIAQLWATQYGVRGICSLHNIQVKKVYQRKGLATVLLNKLYFNLNKYYPNIKYITGEVTSADYNGANALTLDKFYTKEGFVFEKNEIGMKLFDIKKTL